MNLSGVQIPALPPVSRVALGESLNLPEPQFPRLYGAGGKKSLSYRRAWFPPRSGDKMGTKGA